MNYITFTNLIHTNPSTHLNTYSYIHIICKKTKKSRKSEKIKKSHDKCDEDTKRKIDKRHDRIKKKIIIKNSWKKKSDI